MAEAGSVAVGDREEGVNQEDGDTSAGSPAPGYRIESRGGGSSVLIVNIGGREVSG